jgi:hypothetical protein
MRRKTDANLKELRSSRQVDPLGLVNPRASANVTDQAEAIGSIQLAKRVTRYFNTNLASRVERIEADINKDKRFLIFESKQTPIYLNFFDKLASELSERPSPVPNIDKERVMGSAPSKTLPGAMIFPTLMLNGLKKEPSNRAKGEARALDATPNNEPNESKSPSRVRSKQKIQEGDEVLGKSKPKGINLAASQTITLQNFHSIKTEGPHKSRENNLKGEQPYPSGREFKRKDPLPVFRHPIKLQTSSTPKGSESLGAIGFESQRGPVGPSIDDEETDLARHRRSHIFASEQKNQLKRRVTTAGMLQRFQSNIGKIREDASEDDSEKSEEEDLFLKMPSRKMTQGKNSLQLPTRGPGISPLAAVSASPFPNFTLNSGPIEENRLPSFGPEQREDPFRYSDIGKREPVGRSPELKLERFSSESIKKSMTMGYRGRKMTPIEIEHSIEEFEDLSPTQKLSGQFKKGIPETEPQNSDQKNIQIALSYNSITEMPKVSNSKLSTPPKSSRKRGTVQGDRMTGEIALIVRQILERALKIIVEREMYELELINREEERMRQEAKKAEKKIKKQIRDNLKNQIYQMMCQTMPAGSKLPSLFLASKHSESSLLIESVKKGIEKNLTQIEAEITQIYGQNEELRKLSPEDLKTAYPFAISNLSIFTLKTIPDSEVKDVLTTDKLTTEMLAVFRLFYFIHFEGTNFLSIASLNEKALMTEIHDLYQKRLRHLEIGQKPAYRELTFEEQMRLEEFLVNNKSLFSVISDMSLKPFFHSICFYTFEILFYYGMRAYVRFMEKPRERDKNVRNSVYQLIFLLKRVEMMEAQKKEFSTLQRQFDLK